MASVHSFPPLARATAHTLILGSMPGRESLRQVRYYAHPRNAFWPIVSELLDIEGDDYPQKVTALLQRDYALWDVLQSCQRPGSLDSAIRASSVVANDFTGFFSQHPHIRRVFFNGATAESLYRKHVLKALPPGPRELPLMRLPSTSPAHASLDLPQKRQQWRAIL